MVRSFAYILLLGLVSLGWAAKPASNSKKSTAKTSAKKGSTGKSASKSASSRSAATRSTASKGGSRSTTRRASAGRTAAKPASWRTRQMAPTPERYKQIQEALAAKGYLRPEDATGAWNADSVDALRRFQADQNIEGSGKINSLSLIALGLGPKRENLATAKPQTPPQPPPPVQ